MKNYLALFALLSTVACTSTSPVEMAVVNGERISISAEGELGFIQDIFRLKFNNELVIEQKTQPFGGSSQTFNGTFRGKPVMARVTKVVTLFSERYIVDIFYNGQLIETTSL